jgi:pimeloyl-ACP methyl ester carboxylesterase
VIVAHWQYTLGAALCFAAILLIAGEAYERIGERNDKRRRPAPGRLISVGGHKLHLLCKGVASPTVVIEQGAGELSRFWWPLQDRIAQFASVCTYDRAGYDWSEPARSAQTIEERAEQLHTLLFTAGLGGPFLFVAHSYGGFIVRSFAAKYPDEVAGLVLVDTPEESSIFQPEVLDFYSRIRMMNRAVGLIARLGVLRLLKHWMALDRFGFWLERPSEYAALCDDLASLQRTPMSMRKSKEPGSLGSLPLAVITHGQPFPGPFAILEKNWDHGQMRLAQLSTDSVLVRAENSNHMIQQDEPDLVVDVIRRVHVAVRNQTRLADNITEPTPSQATDEHHYEFPSGSHAPHSI